MIVFLATFRSEMLKMTSVRLWWVLAIILAGYVAITAAGTSALFGSLMGSVEQTVPAEMLPPLVYSFGTSVGYVFPVLLGALFATSEFRHQTLTPTFLAVPHRELVLGAKLLVGLIFGLVFGVIGMLSAVGPGAAVLGAFGIDPQLGDSDTWAMVARAVVAMALWSAIGVGLGVLVPSQVAAIVIVLGFTQFLEPILRLAAGFVDVTARIAAFLPGAASDALVGASFFSVAGGGQTNALEWWQGGLVLLAFAVVTTACGYFTSWRRDVT